MYLVSLHTLLEKYDPNTIGKWKGLSKTLVTFNGHEWKLESFNFLAMCLRNVFGFYKASHPQKIKNQLNYDGTKISWKPDERLSVIIRTVASEYIPSFPKPLPTDGIGQWKGISKTLLTFKGNEWKKESFNFLAIFLRNVFGFYKRSHSQTLIDQAKLDGTRIRWKSNEKVSEIIKSIASEHLLPPPPPKSNKTSPNPSPSQTDSELSSDEEDDENDQLNNTDKGTQKPSENVENIIPHAATPSIYPKLEDLDNSSLSNSWVIVENEFQSLKRAIKNAKPSEVHFQSEDENKEDNEKEIIPGLFVSGNGKIQKNYPTIIVTPSQKLEDILFKIDQLLTTQKNALLVVTDIKKQALIVVAYLMAKFDASYESALIFVKNKGLMVDFADTQYEAFLRTKFNPKNVNLCY